MFDEKFNEAVMILMKYNREDLLNHETMIKIETANIDLSEISVEDLTKLHELGFRLEKTSRLGMSFVMNVAGFTSRG